MTDKELKEYNKLLLYALAPLLTIGLTSLIVIIICIIISII